MKQIFEDGSILITGDEDIRKSFYKMFYGSKPGFDGYERNKCEYCIHQDCDEKEYDEFCDVCSVNKFETVCSCHINPPCEFCVNSRFEVTPFLINYRVYFQDNGKQRKKWETIKGDEKHYNLYKKYLAMGIELSCETLITGEIALYLGGEDLKICDKYSFKLNLYSILDEHEEFLKLESVPKIIEK